MGRRSTFVVEIAFSGGWSDVTAYHDYNEPTTIKRGRNSVLDTAQPGTLSLTLFNNDGRFSPTSGSPYWPNVRPNVMIRVTVNGSVRFTGYVDDWIPVYPSGSDTEVRVQVNATDRSRLLSRHILDSTYTETVRVAAPTASVWQWDAIGMICPDVMGNRDASWLEKPTRATYNGSYGTNQYNQGGPVRVSAGVRIQPGVTVTSGLAGNGDNAGAVMRLPADLDFSLSTLHSWSLGFWAKIDAMYDDLGSMGGVDRYKVQLASGNGFQNWSVKIESPDGVAGKVWVADNSTALSGSSTIQALTGDWHYWMIVWTDTHYLQVWRDAVKIAEIFPSPPSADPVKVTLFGLTGPGWGYVYWHPDITVASVTYLSSALTSGDISELYNSSVTGFTGETTHDRAVRLFNVAGLPGGSYLADSGPSAHWGSAQATHGPFDTGGKSVLALGQEIAQAERGLFFVAPDGTTRLADRYARGMSSTPAATFDQEADTSGTDYSAPLRDAQITNMVTVTSASGGSSTAVDYDSITDNYGILSSDITLNVDDAAQGGDYASWVVSQFGAARPRIASVTIDLLTSPTAGIYTSAFNLDIGGRVKVTGLPAGSTSTIFEGFIEGFTEVYSATEVSITLDTSAVAPGEIVLDDTKLGRFTANGETIAGINAVSTSLAVSANPGFYWTGADLPYDIVVGTEQMTVTAGTAPSGGSQTLTVTRGVNGTTATAHNYGEQVNIANEIVLGY